MLQTSMRSLKVPWSTHANTPPSSDILHDTNYCPHLSSMGRGTFNATNVLIERMLADWQSIVHDNSCAVYACFMSSLRNGQRASDKR
eukprot:UN5174